MDKNLFDERSIGFRKEDNNRLLKIVLSNKFDLVKTLQKHFFAYR